MKEKLIYCVPTIVNFNVYEQIEVIKVKNNKTENVTFSSNENGPVKFIHDNL